MKIKNLSKIYKNKYYEVKALDNINIDFGKTGFVFILGESGSGKSTLLNMIAGIDKPTNGSILVGDKNITNFSNSELDKYRNNYISLVFQEYNLIPELNVIDNINLAVNDIDKSNEALKLVGLENYKERKIYELSGGQKQRVAIARSLSLETDVLLLDEPTAALDSKTSEEIIKLLKEISKSKLVIAVTHNREIAYKYNDRIIEIADGRIINDNNKIENSEDENIEFKKCRLSLKAALKLSLNNFKKHKLNQIISSLIEIISLILLTIIIICFITSIGDRIKDSNETNNINSSNIDKISYELISNKNDIIKCYDKYINLNIENKNAYNDIALKGYANINQDIINEYNFKLEGKIPTNSNEIIISKYLYNILNDYYNKDIINTTILLDNKEYIITGILDTGFEYSRFDSLKLTNDNKLLENYNIYLECSPDLYLYVNDLYNVINSIEYEYNLFISTGYYENINIIYKDTSNDYINENGQIVVPASYFQELYSSRECNFLINDITYNNYYDLIVKLLDNEGYSINDYDKYNYIINKYIKEYKIPIDFNFSHYEGNNIYNYKIKGFSKENYFSFVDELFDSILNKSDIKIVISNNQIAKFVDSYKIITTNSQLIYTLNDYINSNLNLLIIIAVFLFLFSFIIIIRNSSDVIKANKKNIGIMKSLGIPLNKIHFIYSFHDTIKNIIIFIFYLILCIITILIINQYSLHNTYPFNIILLNKMPILVILLVIILISVLSTSLSIEKIKKVSIINCINRP